MPVDAVGATIGALGLLNAALETFRIIQHGRSLGKDYGILFYRLEFEGLRLMLWGEESKLQEAAEKGPKTLPDPLCRPIVLNVTLHCLSVIGLLLLGAGPLTARYVPKAIPPAVSLQRERAPVLYEESTIVVVVEAQNTERSIKDALQDCCNKLKIDVEDIQQRNSTFNKLKWAISDRSKFEELVNNLHTFVDNLYSLLPRSQIAHLERRFLSQTLADKDTSALGAIEAAAEGVYRDISMAATLKRIQTSSHSSLTQDRPISVSELKIRKDCLGSLPMGNERWFPANISIPLSASQGTFTKVFVEWKQYERSLADEINEKIQENAYDLALCLQFSYKKGPTAILNCLGFFNDTNALPEPRIGFVHEYPTGTDTNCRPTVLIDVLSQRPPPSLDKRIALSYKLSAVIYQLLASDWLHKSIRGHNILFFHKEAQGGAELPQMSIDITSPYITGFEYSRPDNQHGVSLKPGDSVEFDRYQHPDYSSPSSRSTARYHKLHDIFSLGVVLLEIGLWQSVSSLYAETEKSNARRGREPISPPMQEFQKLYWERYAKELNYRVGPKFETAVKRCLKGDFDLPAIDPDDRGLVQQFGKFVVTELSQCIV